jgi:hypothetical protein
MGDLGGHRVVTTKLPMTGGDGTRDAALIATGSSTTRLLGTFQSVEHVFMVGVGGAVPHYTDFNRHVRLGDVVVSGPPRADDGVSAGQQQKLIYQYCENVTFYPEGDGVKFETKSWCPPEMGLQEIAANLISKVGRLLSNSAYLWNGTAYLWNGTAYLWNGTAYLWNGTS